ncbi:CYTH domain-containing protein [Microbacterium koreense]|uniref:CYTH domain-containing protein n=1 Tax=Microbacterium koreense TaxID=323761 RepID=A0ABW2ZT09_9MICO
MTTDPSQPTRSIEIELKFDVDAETPVPTWNGVPGVIEISSGEVRELDALYVDDAAVSLGRAGYALRRRTGGPDAGWHIKGPRGDDGGRVELQWPLTDGDTPPAHVQAAVAAVSSGPFVPLARIRNRRTVYRLLAASGEMVAEFADDQVDTRDERTGTMRSWHEWEIELGPAGPTGDAERAAFFEAVERAALAAGARSATSASKLARAVDH